MVATTCGRCGERLSGRPVEEYIRQTGGCPAGRSLKEQGGRVCVPPVRVTRDPVQCTDGMRRATPRQAGPSSLSSSNVLDCTTTRPVLMRWWTWRRSGSGPLRKRLCKPSSAWPTSLTSEPREGYQLNHTALLRTQIWWFPRRVCWT